MAKDTSVSLPGFGGLTRYNEEYESLFNPTPNQVLIFVGAIVLFRVALGIFL
jgi:hypothetical protein